MIIEITETTLKRLGNYQAVVQKENLEADSQQWRVMTLEVLQAAQKAKIRAGQVNAAVSYARYLHRLQSGQDHRRSIYAEPLLSQALTALLNELSIEQKMVAEVDSGVGAES